MGIIIAIVGIASVVLIVTEGIWNPSRNTLPYELVRVCVQILGVAVVGFFVGLASFLVQQSKDERRRLEERVRDLFAETVTAYNAVKRVRRLLEAETTSESASTITVSTYSRLLEELCEQQLVFENLKRSAPLIQARVRGAMTIIAPAPESAREKSCGTLKEHYSSIESYLNEIVEEYQKNRHLVPADPSKTIDELKLRKLKEFISDTQLFKAKVSYRIDGILRVLENSLLTSKEPRGGASLQ
ncbi:hypothetical protein [Streptomyces sp. IB201691-2A2]|uniref:hypothetical protein n=1 Tax=Streptomyces sp. IB201691-2A2 TaxID=2561920 RepID=UPI001180AA20|nr:hypothetical protein [Streptomyces sp. IB201691-2A2]TRO58515.1 hypothetical protein E4K73_38290 [Streptomyces sp. IB201691-2A2]